MPTHPRVRPSLYPSVSAFLLVLTAPWPAGAAFPEGGGFEGEWELRNNDAAAQRISILSISSVTEGNLTGSWITDAGWSELDDIARDDGAFSFTWEAQQESGQAVTRRFSGVIEGDNLRGTISTSDDQQEVTGRRIPRMPDIVGNWAFSYSRDRVTLALAVRVGDDGEQALFWRTVDGDVPITDFTFAEDQLTFTSKRGNYAGRLVRPDALNGTLTVGQREYSVLAARMGTPLIGAWDLEVTSDGRTRRQRLKINADMSGWYGITSIEEVRLEHDVPVGGERDSHAVTFHTGDSEESGELSFVGEVSDGTLSGEITTPPGTSRVQGRKLNSSPPSETE